MDKGELMEMGNESLSLLALQVQEEFKRRNLDMEAVAIHRGNVSDGKPLPQMVRVIKKLAGRSPGDISKIEALLDAWAAGVVS